MARPGSRSVPDSLVVRRAVDEGKPPPVWLWTGPETWLKEDLFARLVGRAGGEMASLNVSRFHLPESKVGEILSTCLSLPMLADRRLVLVSDLDRLPKDDQESLLAYVARPAPDTVLVLSSERFASDAFHRELARAGAVVATFETPTPEQSAKWIEIRFRDLEKECDPEVARELTRRCGGGTGEPVSLKQIAPEIEKVVLHMGKRREVTEEDLVVIGRKADEELLRNLVACVSRRDVGGALRALDGALLFRENTEVRIVANLAYRILDLLGARGKVESGVPPGEALRSVWFRMRPEYEAGLERYEAAELERALAVLSDADRLLKSSPKNPRVVLEQTIVSICGG